MSISAADRPGRRLFLMGATYALGTFNDNFFKQAACLLALSFGLKEIQGAAGIFFALPFVLFSAWAGWLADRLPKSSIIVWAKGLEVLAMALGAYGLITLDWHFILAMVATMGLQSAIFSPALNGSIPETVSGSSVPKVNAALKLATTLAILAGIALAGVGLDQSWGQAALPAEISFGRVFVAAVALLAALLGLAAAMFISPGPVKGMRPQVHFPWAGPIDSLRDCMYLRREPSLGLALLAEAYFYFVSSLAVFLINDLGETQLHLSFSQTSLLPAALMLGLCAGSLLAGKGSPLSWQKLLMPAGAGMGAGLLLSGLAPLFAPEIRLGWLIGAYLLTGFAGGIYLIPITSFIQVRPCPFEKGRVLGISGFASFVGIVISGACYNLLTARLPPSAGLVVAGAASLGAALLFGLGIRLIQSDKYGIDPSLRRNLNAVTLAASIFPSDKNTL
ncbi:MAG: MFS transporter [Desulfovibrionaceae bacterium]|nr:MFS transporter [Desulfovibrionaceae bacterium]